MLRKDDTGFDWINTLSKLSGEVLNVFEDFFKIMKYLENMDKISSGLMNHYKQ